MVCAPRCYLCSKSLHTAAVSVIYSGSFSMSNDAGTNKVSIIADSAEKATYEVTDEDHTLGNALRYMLIRK